MSESLQLPTLSPPLASSEEGRLGSDQTISKVDVTNDNFIGAHKAGNGMSVGVTDTGVSMISETSDAMVNSSCPNDETKASMNSMNDLDINDDTPSSNILPQMNVYILDDTPSVASQPPLPLTPVKDVAGLHSEPSTGLLRTSPYKEPDTTLSLDKEEPVSDLDKSPPSDHDRRVSYESNRHGNNPLMMISARADPDDHHHHGDDDDSSNDDSSYFASHLPEPNSGRRYSFASNASQNSTTLQQPPTQSQQFPTSSSAPHRQQNIHGRESDASLSLSDDSDDNIRVQPQPVMFGPQQGVHPQNPQYYPQQYNYYQAALQQQQHQNSYPLQPGQQQQSAHFQSLHHHHQQQPPHQFVMPPPRMGGGVPELYPEQIMPRMHSVNSLASTSSHNSSGSDTSLPDELQNVVSSQQRRLLNRGSSNNSHLPSGRRSPILGEHPPSRGASQHLALPPFGSPSSVNLQPSPPMILHSFSAGTAANYSVGGTNDGTMALPHPQPHSMTPEELASWTVAATQSHPKYNNSDPRSIPFGEQPPSSTLHGGTTSYPSISGSRGESDFAYSGDSDSNIHHHQQQQHQQQQYKHAFGEPNRGKGSLLNDEHNLRSSSWDQSHGTHGPLDGGGGGGFGTDATNAASEENRGFKVYWQRWIMLMYMSILNLLSDWTCYSVAPIALLTEEAFGEINAEQLVVVFLIANGIATACEPIILSRLGLRRTILFGSLLLMIGSIVKSGGMPPIIQADLKKGQGEWRVYLGFFLVGLSQPLYQCTPALLSASWFPEAERTLATGVALNANQLGIGFAFIFGTMLVETSDDIPKYFGLLSILSTLTFLGTLVQFDDAPPTPPSDTAKVMRGTLEAKLPSVQSIFETVRNIGVPTNPFDIGRHDASRRNSSRKDKSRLRNEKYQRTVSSESKTRANKSEEAETRHATESKSRPTRRSGTSDRRSNRRAVGSGTNIARRRVAKLENTSAVGSVTDFHAVVPSPSPALWGPVRQEYDDSNASNVDDQDSQAPLIAASNLPIAEQQDTYEQNSIYYHNHPHFPLYPGHPGEIYNNHPTYPPQYQIPYWDPQYAQFIYYQQQQAQLAYYQLHQMPPPDPYMSYQHSHQYQPYPFASYEPLEHLLPAAEAIDEGAEPVITILPHHLDIHIRDDQIWLSTRACLARPGFIHSLVSFTVSGVVINTLSTFMDYLVRLNGAGREYTGIVGGTFQFVIMISSLIIGKVCDKTRAYYSITIGMLVLGAFGLAECGVSLDSNSGVSLRWSLIIVALLVGPLQPVSTELGVDVVYPLSENTVLVIQQLFSNLLSAAFIPCFKAMRNLGEGSLHDGTTERPAYTFSFYLLIVVHACATVFFATFNGRYLRYEHELEKQAQDERRKYLQQQAHSAP